MTLSVPLAQNVPAVSLGALLDPKRPNTAKTSLFQNVLDALQLPDENMSDSSQQQPNQQPVSIQKAGSPVAQESSITAQQQLSQPHGGPQLSTIAFLPVHLYAAPTAAPLLEQVAQVGSLQQGESSEQEFGPSSVRGEASKRTLDQQPHVPEISDSDKRETSAPVVNFVPTRLTLAASAPEPASMQALSLAPAPSQQAVIPAPVKEDPAVQPHPQQITHSSQSASPTAPLQSAKSSVPAESSRSQSTATATAAANVEPIATNAGGSITKETARAISITPASEPIANPKSEPAAEMANHSRVRNPEPFDSSVLAAKPAAPELTEPIAAAKDSPIGTNASEPAKSNKESGPVAPPPGSDHAGTSLITAAAAPQASQNVRHAGQISPKELLRKTAAVQTHASQKTPAPERIPAYWQASPTTTQPPPTPHAQQYPVPPSSEPGVPVQTITPPALPSVPSGPTASPTETQPATPLRQSARKSDTAVSRQVRTATEEKKSVQDAIVPASPITNANTADLLVQSLTQPAPLAPAREPSTATAPSSEVSPREPTISSRIEREPLAAPVAASTAPKSPITPEPANVAFELRMLAPESVINNSQQIVNKSTAALPEPAVIQAKSSIPEPKTDTLQQAQQQSMAQGQTPENTRHGTESPASTSEKPDPRSTKDGSPQRPTEAANISPRWSEIGAPQTTDVGPAHSSAELTKAPGDNSPLAIQETHIAAPEMPKATGPSEILLHLAGGDHASAAIRVAERAGTVNVSVHASDPVLRESLRSNLGDLSAQLGQQGWKAEVTKPAVFPTPSDNQQDSHARGQQSSHQRHAFGGDRQAPRERRNTKDWQQELDQQFSSGSALSGGKQ